MLKKSGWLNAGLALAAFSTAGVVRTGRREFSRRPRWFTARLSAFPRAAWRGLRRWLQPPLWTPAVGVARVGAGAPGVGVRAGTPMNRGGPVNRVGRR